MTFTERILSLFRKRKTQSKSYSRGIKKVRLDGRPYSLMDFKFLRPYKFIDENGKDI